ncbi:hypothetical protein L596_024909 [Steinernema carpocapsae]|uniref:Tyrosine-protein phosphatase domain-containing protein n=1 Tax=Steinernema carpocapsae TaxID=34508 RepID=A0A4U5M671_STECR|nr:hypothetical protein L596_024909 [Steinernema carpocapsae]
MSNVKRGNVAASMMKGVEETRSENIHQKKPPKGTGRPLGKKAAKKADTEIEPTVDDNGETKNKKKKRTGVKVAQGKNAITPEVDAAIEEFVTYAAKLGLEGVRKEFGDLKAYTPPNFNFNAFTANEARNRYKDVVCVDSTRVTLTLNVPPEPDYIHANWVKMDKVEKTFIAAQGPLDNTISDFWRMIHQEGVTTILMLCKVEEGGKVKCSQYWPVENGTFQTYGCMLVNNKKVEKEDHLDIITLEVLPEGCSNSTITKLIQVGDWPDKGVPKSGMSVLRLLKLISPGGPCVVHCSAGIGRTGTVIAIETMIQRIFKAQPTNMKDVVMQLRNQRASSIQTEGQYCFAYLCVLYYISAKTKKYNDQMRAFQEEYHKSDLC